MGDKSEAFLLKLLNQMVFVLYKSCHVARFSISKINIIQNRVWPDESKALFLFNQRNWICHCMNAKTKIASADTKSTIEPGSRGFDNAPQCGYRRQESISQNVYELPIQLS